MKLDLDHSKSSFENLKLDLEYSKSSFENLKLDLDYSKSNFAALGGICSTDGCCGREGTSFWCVGPVGGDAQTCSNLHKPIVNLF